MMAFFIIPDAGTPSAFSLTKSGQKTVTVPFSTHADQI